MFNGLLMFSHFYHNARFSTQLVEMDLSILTSLKFQTQWKIVHLMCVNLFSLLQ